jgi:hypothetical protein
MTVKVDPAIEKAWLQWLQQEHLPDIMASQQFTHWKMFRLLEQDDTEGMTFVIQCFASSRENYDRYVQQHDPMLQRKAFNKWGERFIAFRTVMQVVD